MTVQNLRKTYIDKGKLSVCHDHHGRPYIELVECLRVFPDRFSMREQPSPATETPVADNPVALGFLELQQKYDTLESEHRIVRERLQIEQERRMSAETSEAWLRSHVDKLTEENLKLISAPDDKQGDKKRGWFSWLSA